MRFLGAPEQSAVSVYKSSISKMRSKDAKARFIDATAEIEHDSKRYIAALAAGQLSLEEHFTLRAVTQDEMARHYKNRFAAKDGPAHATYDQIKVRARGRCPLCGPRTVGTLDHYWPKNPHTSLAIHPMNLVPCCWVCNHRKGEFQPTRRDEELLHPYVDDLGTEVWLNCEIVEVGGGYAFLFEPLQPAAWSPTRFQRVRHHFHFFNLDELYASQAANELESIRYSLAELLAKDGAKGVGTHLEREARSRERNEPNGWQAGMYRAMASSAKFYSGPF